MSQAPEDSPNELTPGPHVRRLNRVPLLIAGVLLSVLLAAVAYSYYARLAKTTGKPEEERKPEPAPVLLKDAPDAGFIPREKESQRPAVAPFPKEPVAPPEPQDEARKLAWESYRQKLERRRALREEATLQAVLANTNAGFASPKPVASPTKESEPVPQSERFADLAERLRRLDGSETQDRDLNRAGEGLASSVFAIEPGFLLMPLLAILLPRLGVSAGAGIPVAIATTLALLVPLSIAELRLLTTTERRHVAWLSPAILAGAFFGASLVPLVPGQWLLAGFAVTSLFALLRPPAAKSLTLVVTPPRRRTQPFAAILKSAVSSAFGIGLPLSDDRASEKAALSLMLALAAMTSLLTRAPACRGCGRQDPSARSRRRRS